MRDPLRRNVLFEVSESLDHETAQASTGDHPLVCQLVCQVVDSHGACSMPPTVQDVGCMLSQLGQLEEAGTELHVAAS